MGWQNWLPENSARLSGCLGLISDEEVPEEAQLTVVTQARRTLRAGLRPVAVSEQMGRTRMRVANF